jgi:two-component system cell cycle response regulator
VKVLLIDDDRLQHRLTQGFFLNFRRTNLQLEGADNYETGLAKLLTGEYAACLLDYQLGTRDGLELIRQAVAADCRTPIIFLTAEMGGNVDEQAMEAGALDYLVKGEINPQSLERSLRYALKMGETLDALRLLATRDELTHLLNRREFDRLLVDEEERGRRFNHALSLVFLDIDFFKKINDTHGHAAGDEVLRAIAQRLRQNVRLVDRVARFGGEEFVVLLPETTMEGALALANRVVTAIATEPVTLGNGMTVAVTISAGVAEMRGDQLSGQALVESADRALYSAKALGRNRAVAA